MPTKSENDRLRNQATRAKFKAQGLNCNGQPYGTPVKWEDEPEAKYRFADGPSMRRLKEIYG